MALTNDLNIKKQWDKPTVSHVYSLMLEAAERYKLDDWRLVHKKLGVSDRTFRRWVKNVKTDPLSLSSIPFTAYALLNSAALGESYIQPLAGNNWKTIPKKYFYAPQNYTCPPKEVLTQFVGLKSLTGQTREQIGQIIGIAPKKLAEQINLGSVSWITWSLLLLYVGAPVNMVLNKQ
ncbi:hypothetical protein Q5N48_17335 [Vibrio cholerae]|uniref:hypothetical protein n=1 Tax=Vibrio cholerae TaxID=666 RepID=UPI0029346005|nr:hypothetical protein [Vibrio cholerae]EGR1020288.1 hypothetical protein [Vibrio cholerae]MDV2358389.1 hypothetical protein [Vibrio cholerae]HCJ6874146.1 hypothetical protein [Vibrio cholerae]